MAADYRMSGAVRGALILAGVLALLGVAIGDSWVGLFICLIDAVLLVFAMAQMPLRYSMYGLTFLVFTLPNPAEGFPTEWAPPFAGPGAIMLNHLNTVDRSLPISFMVISGLDFFFVCLGLIIFYRRTTKSNIDRRGGFLPTPKPMIHLAWLALASSVFVELSGLIRGGNFNMSLWQLNVVMYLPCLFLLFQAAIRGPQDFEPLLKTLLYAVVYKSCLAVYVHYGFTVPMDPVTGSTKPVYATSHTDSIFFASIVVFFAIFLLENVSKKARLWALFFVPLVLLAIVANNRRLAWAEVGLSMFALVLVTRPSKVKKRLLQAVAAAIPVAIIYVIVGWNSQYGALFKPVRMIRSIADAKTDGSSMWREFENVNIIATFRANPIFGTGYGHPYVEVIVLPAVEYPLEPYIPHNSLLGLWGYTGLTGFATLTLLWAGAMYLGMRAYRYSDDAKIRAAALCSYVAFFIYLMQAWGDIGLGTWMGVFLASAAFTVACKSAVAAGQWEGSSKAGARRPYAPPS